MNSGRKFQRHTIETYLIASRGVPDDVNFADLVDSIVEYLDSQSITPERFRGFSYPATRNAIETALQEVTSGESKQ